MQPCLLTLAASLLLYSHPASCQLNTVDSKAASPYLNLGCQCVSPSLTYLDSLGLTQGNCLTTDHTGARWCYVDLRHTTCTDLVISHRFPGKAFSYEACATPPNHSFSYGHGPPAPLLAPGHPLPAPHYPPQHHHQQHHHQAPLYPGGFIGEFVTLTYIIRISFTILQDFL